MKTVYFLNGQVDEENHLAASHLRKQVQRLRDWDAIRQGLEVVKNDKQFLKSESIKNFIDSILFSIIGVALYLKY